jgi:hypothetical protein
MSLATLIVTYHLTQQAAELCKQTPVPAQICVTSGDQKVCQTSKAICGNPHPKVAVLSEMGMWMDYETCCKRFGWQAALANYEGNVENMQFYEHEFPVDCHERVFHPKKRSSGSVTN